MRSRDAARAREFFEALSNEDRWALGDALVLGDFQWTEWTEHGLTAKPSAEFMNELYRARMTWEQEEP